VFDAKTQMIIDNPTENVVLSSFFLSHQNTSVENEKPE
jgi:hypothetical protein